jgi:hypothetical protein
MFEDVLQKAEADTKIHMEDRNTERSFWRTPDSLPLVEDEDDSDRTAH